MTSLRGSLPPAGSTLWQKERRTSSLDSNQTGTSLITHIVIREVWKKTIPSPHAVYKIDVMTKSNHWYVLKRYREFSKLHSLLVSAYGIPKDMLPPKKITSNLSLKHLEKRRDALEHYLQRLVNSSTYVSSSPEVLAFLEVSKHDVTSVTRLLAKELLHAGDAILAEGGSYVFTLTQLYCITRQLQLPEQVNTTEDHSVDLGHLYGFIYQLEELCVVPSSSKSSQELVTHLEFDVSLFKALRSLKIDGCPVYLIKGLDSLQGQLKYLAVRHSLKTMGELLVDRVIGRRKASTSSTGSVAAWRNQATAKLTKNRVIIQPWVQLTNLTLAHNKLSTFDESLKLLPALQSLDLKYNQFVTVDLQEMHCPSLTHLDMSYNHICSLSGHSRNLPNLKSLILSHNKLESLSCLESLCGLIELDLTNNQVGSLKELRNLSGMSQLRYLSVDGNPLTKVKSYRVQIFSFFYGRKIFLDNKPQISSDEAPKSMWPTRSRSFSTPGSFAGDDSGDIVRLVRANSDVASAIVHDDINSDDDNDDDDDSGIEGYASFSTNVTTNVQEEEMEFNWSYFDFLDIGNPGVFSSGATMNLEEQVQEDMCENALQSTSSTESASEVVVNDDSAIMDNISETQDTSCRPEEMTSMSTPLKLPSGNEQSEENLEANGNSDVRSNTDKTLERFKET